MTTDVADYDYSELTDADIPVMDLSETTESINMMVYGEPGIGKTPFGASDERPTFIIATENGTLSAARMGLQAKVLDARGGWERLEAAYNFLYDHCKEERFPHRWVVIDTATRAQHLGLRSVVDDRKDGAKNGNKFKVNLDEYGIAQEMWRDYVVRMNDLPINTLWLAHEMMGLMPDGSSQWIPSFQGKDFKISIFTMAEMHVFGRMAFREVEHPKTGEMIRIRGIQWHPSEDTRARDRFDVLPSFTQSVKGAKTLAKVTSIIEKGAAVPAR